MYIVSFGCRQPIKNMGRLIWRRKKRSPPSLRRGTACFLVIIYHYFNKRSSSASGVCVRGGQNLLSPRRAASARATQTDPKQKQKEPRRKTAAARAKKINSPRKRRHEWVFRLCSSAGVRVCASSPLRARGHLSPCRRLDAKRYRRDDMLFLDIQAPLRL